MTFVTPAKTFILLQKTHEPLLAGSSATPFVIRRRQSSRVVGRVRGREVGRGGLDTPCIFFLTHLTRWSNHRLVKHVQATLAVTQAVKAWWFSFNSKRTMSDNSNSGMGGKIFLVIFFHPRAHCGLRTEVLIYFMIALQEFCLAMTFSCLERARESCFIICNMLGWRGVLAASSASFVCVCGGGVVRGQLWALDFVLR